MIVALLTTLIATATTGYMMTTDVFWGSKWVEEVHEAFADILLGLIVFHVLGAVVTSLTNARTWLSRCSTDESGRRSYGRSLRHGQADKLLTYPNSRPSGRPW
jgi:cytochrome b